MSHEPECTFRDKPKEVSGVCWCCAGIRNAYQRGRNDAASEAYAAIQRVRDLHQRREIVIFDTPEVYCFECPYSVSESWPCPTICALDGIDE